MNKVRICIIISFVLLLSSFAYASPNDFYKIFFNDKGFDSAKFVSSKFLSVVPEKKLLEIRDLYVNQLGKYLSSKKIGSKYCLEFENGKAMSTVSFDNDGKVKGLWFSQPTVQNDSIEKIKADLQALNSEIAVCVIKNNKDIVFDLNSGKPLACGSAFKLYLLEALIHQVKSGKRSWTDVVRLRDDWKSFPSGLLQNWPSKSPVTLYTLAGLMISMSDNTATDHIFHILGRNTVRKYLPKTCIYCLDTCEVLKLKFAFPEKGREYISASPKEKKSILLSLAREDVGKLDISKVFKPDFKPFLIDKLEWFISPYNLCKVIYRLKNTELITINPAYGLVDKKDWHFVGFKGGSEPGVLNLTWILQKSPDKPLYAVSCTINNSEKQPDSKQFMMIAKRILKLISEDKL